MTEYTQDDVDRLIWDAETQARRESKRVILSMLLAVGGEIIVPDRISLGAELGDYTINVEAKAGSMCTIYRAVPRGR